SVRKSDASAPQEEPGRLRILAIGDFGGGSDTDPQATQGPKGLKVDYDNFDAVVARVKPLVRLPTESDPAIHFHSLEDFHPDRLLLNSEPLARLVELRKRLADPSTFEGAASAVKELLRVAPEPGKSVAEQPPDDVLNQLLGKPVSKNAIRTA